MMGYITDFWAYKEFAGLSDDANIYKLIGPVLIKQDKAEAVMNVDKRLEYIESEMYAGHPSCIALKWH
jgi:chaperonin cofactor prefoldin